MPNSRNKILSFSILPLIDNVDLSYLYKLKTLGLTNLHYDVMDEFTGTRGFSSEHVQNLHSLGFKINVHLMVKRIATAILDFVDKPCDGISFHVEALQTINEGLQYIEYIKNAGKQVGIAIKMDTPIELYWQLLQQVDYVTLMSVVPGKGGQKFNSLVFDNIHRLQKLANQMNFECPRIEFDGGITKKEIDLLWDYGTFFVSGSWFHNQTDAQKEILLKEIANKA